MKLYRVNYSYEVKGLQKRFLSKKMKSVSAKVVGRTSYIKCDELNIKDEVGDDLSKIERTVYNNLGISRNLFNTDGNLSLEKSILNDESTARNLLLQFNVFFDRIVKKRNVNSKKYNFKIYFLETTQYNY